MKLLAGIFSAGVIVVSFSCSGSPVADDMYEYHSINWTEADLPVLRSCWTRASLPETSFMQPALDTAVTGTLIWYNPMLNDRQSYIREGVTYFRGLEIEPDELNLNLIFRPLSGDTHSWAGIMMYLPPEFHDQTDNNYLEIVLAGDKGRINIDVGDISEDVIINGRLNHEDRNENGALEAAEDVGLDGIPDGEPGDMDDNYSYADGSDDYSTINLTEGNRYDPLRYWMEDTEDINGNYRLDWNNRYFAYSIDLTDTLYLTGQGSQGRVFRIPLWDNTDQQHARVNYPVTTRIKFMRIWLEGFDRPDTVVVSRIGFVE